MEIVVEQAPTPCEIERGKPMPDLTHALIQANLIVELRIRCSKEIQFLSELSLAAELSNTTPDVATYPPFTPDDDNQPARQSEPPLCCIEIQSQSQSLKEYGS